MPRLNDKAFAILARELERCVGSDPSRAPEKHLVLQRLERLRQRTGNPLSADELRGTICDVIPEFRDSAIRQAIRANQPPGMFRYLSWGAMGLVGAAGLLYIINLPYPMIRWPVARTVPLLLLPSYMKMDYDYRGAIANVEQADQLVNQATSVADIDLGGEKAKQAQKHLDGLPVWFLGYFPQRYCTFFSCSWQFTLDEYEGARKKIARIEAKVFQEDNALTLLEDGEAQVRQAKAEYQQAGTSDGKQAAIVAWQEGMDNLNRIPAQTLARRLAEPQMSAYQRDFQQVAGLRGGLQKTDTLIQAAGQYGMAAAQMSQNPPHTEDVWQEIVQLWQNGVNQLERVGDDNPAYVEAQKKLAEYKTNVATARIRRKAEGESVQYLDSAKRKISNWQRSAGSGAEIPDLVSQLQQIIYDLDRVQAGTTATEEARSLQEFAEAKMQELAQ